MRQSFKLLDWSRRLATIDTMTEPLNQDYHEKALLSFTSSPLEVTTNNAHTDHPKQVRTPEQVQLRQVQSITQNIGINHPKAFR